MRDIAPPSPLRIDASTIQIYYYYYYYYYYYPACVALAFLCSVEHTLPILDNDACNYNKTR